MTSGNDPVDRPAAERALIELAAEDRVVLHPLGDDALWALAGAEPGYGQRRALAGVSGPATD